MPKKTRPRSRPQLIRLLSAIDEPDFLGSVYPREVIEVIAEKYKLTPLVSSLTKAIHAAAVDYERGGPYRSHDVPEFEEQADEFVRLSKAATEIGNRLNWLSEADSWSAFHNIQESQLRGTQVKTLAGWTTVDDDWTAVRQMVNTCRAIAKLLETAAFVKRPQRRGDLPERGRLSEYGLEAFVAQLAEFWVHVAKRRFTLDYHKGAPLTESALFLVDCLSPMDDVPPRAVITAARKIQAEMRTHKK